MARYNADESDVEEELQVNNATHLIHHLPKHL
jgi:hypothetical protein